MPDKSTVLDLITLKAKIDDYEDRVEFSMSATTTGALDELLGNDDKSMDIVMTKVKELAEYINMVMEESTEEGN